jgi:hypothetical protein
MQTLDDPDPNLQQRVLLRLQRGAALYELWSLPSQGRHRLVLHRNGEVCDAASSTFMGEAMAKAEAWRIEVHAALEDR